MLRKLVILLAGCRCARAKTVQSPGSAILLAMKKAKTADRVFKIRINVPHFGYAFMGGDGDDLSF